MAKKELISGREYGRRLKIDERVVRKAITNGLIVKGYDKDLKKINPAIADKEWGHLHKVPKPKAGVSRAKAIKKLEGIPREQSAPPEPPPAILLEGQDLDELVAALKITSTTPAPEAMRIREVIGAISDIKKLQEVEGKLVQRDVVEKALHAAGNELKKQLFNIPQRAVRDIMHAPNEVAAINILKKEITEALNSFLNHKYNFVGE